MAINGEWHAFHLGVLGPVYACAVIPDDLGKNYVDLGAGSVRVDVTDEGLAMVSFTSDEVNGVRQAKMMGVGSHCLLGSTADEARENAENMHRH